MATVRLSDAVIPEVYRTYTALNSPEKTEFFQAGLITRNALLDGIAREGGRNAIVPFWKDLDSSIEPNASNDDPDDLATPNKVGSGSMGTRKAWLNQGFSSMDLIVELTGSDPMPHIRNRFGTYWMRQWQRRLIATCRGLMAANVAKNGSDMTIDISAETGADAIFNSDAVIDAQGTMGDALTSGGKFAAIAVHSAVHTRMVKNDEIVYIPDSQGGLTIPTYKGLRVIIDDALVVSGVGADRLFLSVLFGSGAFGYGTEDGSTFAFGEGVPRVPVEVERQARAGNGGGEETIWERKTWILHPGGFSWTEGTGADAPVEMSPMLADLIKPVHWDRVVDRKQAPFAFILSKA